MKCIRANSGTLNSGGVVSGGDSCFTREFPAAAATAPFIKFVNISIDASDVEVFVGDVDDEQSSLLDPRAVVAADGSVFG